VAPEENRGVKCSGGAGRSKYNILRGDTLVAEKDRKGEFAKKRIVTLVTIAKVGRGNRLAGHERKLAPTIWSPSARLKGTKKVYQKKCRKTGEEESAAKTGGKPHKRGFQEKIRAYYPPILGPSIKALRGRPGKKVEMEIDY